MLAHKCLEVIPFNKVSPTAFNLKNFLSEVLRECKIVDKAVAVVRDSGGDIVAAINMSKFTVVSCTANTLQLFIKYVLGTNAKFSNLNAKSKRIVGSFAEILCRSEKRLSNKEHRMVQDEPTRWNSTYHTMVRFLEQKMRTF